MPKMVNKKRQVRMAKAEYPSHINVDCELDLEAAKPDEGKKLPTFSMVANTGRPMRVAQFAFPVVIDMTGARFANQKTPVIMDHDVSKRIGHTTSRNIGANNITAAGIVSSKMNVAQGFVEDASNGFPFQTSIGADIESAIFLDEGEKQSVNGKMVKGPVIVAQKSVISELTVTVLGADNKTKVSVAAMADNDHSKEAFTMKFAEWLQADYGVEVNDLTDDQKTKFTAKYEAEFPDGGTKPTKKTKKIRASKVDDVDDEEMKLQKQRDLQASEDERIELIRTKVNSVIAEYNPTEESRTKIVAIRSSAIKEGWTVDKTELRCIREARPKAPAGHIESGADESIESKALVCAIARSLGTPDSETNRVTGREFGLEHDSDFNDKVLEASRHRRYRDVSLHSMMDMNIRLAGMSHTGSRRSNDYLRTFLQATRDLEAAGGFSSLALTNILESVANKNLLASFSSQETVWDQLVAKKNLNDFKVHNYYRLTTTGGYAKVGAGGELKHGEMSDTKYTVQGDTYGMILALTRQDMINDDLDAFNQIPAQLGRLSSLAIEFAVLEMITANAGSIFAAGNNNLMSAGDVDFDHEGLTAAAKLFRDQTNDNKPILVSPDRVLVGSQDEVTAGDLFAEKNVNVDDSGVANDKRPARNSHVGKYRPIVSPILNNTDIKQMDGSAFTVQNANHWYMSCNPAVLAAFYVGFLNGQGTPVIESGSVDFETLGMKWRSYHDWGTGEGDPEGMLKSNGA